jgi:hypothetical protein
MMNNNEEDFPQEDYDDLDNFLRDVHRDMEVSKCLQEWIVGITAMYPILRMGKGLSKARQLETNKRVALALRSKGVEMSVEDSEIFNKMLDMTLELIEIFDKNYEIWAEQGKTIAENEERDGIDDEDLNDLLGF